MLKPELVVWKVKERFWNTEEKNNGNGEKIKAWKRDPGDTTYK